MIDLHLLLIVFAYLRSNFSGELRKAIFFARVRFGRIPTYVITVPDGTWRKLVTTATCTTSSWRRRYLNVTERQTDRRTDGQTDDILWHNRALASRGKKW